MFRLWRGQVRKHVWRHGGHVCWWQTFPRMFCHAAHIVPITGCPSMMYMHPPLGLACPTALRHPGKQKYTHGGLNDKTFRDVHNDAAITLIVRRSLETFCARAVLFAEQSTLKISQPLFAWGASDLNGNAVRILPKYKFQFCPSIAFAWASCGGQI